MFGCGPSICDVDLTPTKMGWQCPKCTRIHSPYVDRCACNLDLATMQPRKPDYTPGSASFWGC